MIDVRTVDSVIEVTIDVPKANAIDAATSRELGAVFEQFRDDPGLRVAVITGAGDRFFSAGWDLKAAAAGEEFEADYGPGGFGGYPELPELNKPVIAAVNGMAVGGGFELVLAADLVVAAEHAEFFFGELKAGIIPDSATVRLPRRIPIAQAKELILTGMELHAEEAVRRLTAAEAKDWGLVNRVVAAEDLQDASLELAHEVASLAPLAVGAAIGVMRETAHLSVAEAFAAMRGGDIPPYTRMVESEDAEEGPRAFAEGRDPEWKGR